jgi:hypothetical protein
MLNMNHRWGIEPSWIIVFFVSSLVLFTWYLHHISFLIQDVCVEISEDFLVVDKVEYDLNQLDWYRLELNSVVVSAVTFKFGREKFRIMVANNSKKDREKLLLLYEILQSIRGGSLPTFWNRKK